MAKRILADFSAEFLKSEFSFNPETGQFIRLKSRNRWKIGDTAGSVSKSSGYVVISINKKLYLAHRLAWLYVHGSWPLRTIDHINGCKTDNRISNLRDVEHCENCRNRPEQSNNKSGSSGVHWRERERRWYVDAKRSGKRVYIGRFVNLPDAIKAREEWELNNPIEPTKSFLRQGITLNGLPV